jgi:hypothetical protein
VCVVNSPTAEFGGSHASHSIYFAASGPKQYIALLHFLCICLFQVSLFNRLRGIPSRLHRGRMMAQYPRMDPYSRSRYEQGIDAKIVVMGNTGPDRFLSSSIIAHICHRRRQD